MIMKSGTSRGVIQSPSECAMDTIYIYTYELFKKEAPIPRWRAKPAKDQKRADSHVLVCEGRQSVISNMVKSKILVNVEVHPCVVREGVVRTRMANVIRIQETEVVHCHLADLKVWRPGGGGIGLRVCCITGEDGEGRRGRGRRGCSRRALNGGSKNLRPT